MLGLSTLGIVHTAISLVALGAAIIALVRYKEISPRTLSGKTYVITTILTCLTGFGIFRNGTFGPPHILGVITLVVLAVAWAAKATKMFGRASPYVETVAYSATVFFHLVPAFTETLTRLPVGAPVASGPNDPILQGPIGVSFVAFLVGATLQVLRLRAAAAATRRVLPA
ncbi:hypothetical protein [Polyangium jinanense]|uniref:DUF2306 domain-containing protein n=1 Tax=Polyangium jinanense TaxID=2829994 RepID=A0A9X3X5D4_9BACT|nr:hypothetical protein [Polyangium jinanense]MDC3962788.1 hypothetical protein [Polyangium jinanense]MDC3983897.1 hypothetical protein [Polyangium jinanense]